MVIFLDFYFRENKPENFFYDILEGRNAFLHYKNKKLKKSKNWDCYKGISPWFRSKIGKLSRISFLGEEIGAEKCVYDILEGRNPFLNYENKKFNKTINWDFYKRVSPWFWSKIGNFSRLLF